MREIELIHKSGPFRDECSLYDVQIEKGTTVQDVIDFALNKKEKWGEIEVYDEHSFLHSLDYVHGVIKKDAIPTNIKSRLIKDITAYGGWSHMDYSITT